MIPENIILQGNRAMLVPMERNHLNGLMEAGNFPEVWEHLQMNITDLSEMENYFNTALLNKENRTEFPFTIIDQQTNKIVGSTRFYEIRLNHKGLEIGSTWLTPSVWGTDFNTECKYLLLKFCFEELKMIRVQFKTDNLNSRSQKAILKLGATYEGTLRNHIIRRDGSYRNSVYFSITIDEWEIIKFNLENKLNRSLSLPK